MLYSKSKNQSQFSPFTIIMRIIRVIMFVYLRKNVVYVIIPRGIKLSILPIFVLSTNAFILFFVALVIFYYWIFVHFSPQDQTHAASSSYGHLCIFTSYLCIQTITFINCLIFRAHPQFTQKLERKNMPLELFASTLMGPIYDVRKILGFFYPSPLSALGTDLQY